MPAFNDRHSRARPSHPHGVTRRAPRIAAERLEARVLWAAGAPAPFAPYTNDAELFQLCIDAAIGSPGDVDFYSLGRLHAGDRLSVAQPAAGSARGTLADGALELYRAGGNPAEPVFITLNDDGGSGSDPLILQRLLAHDDEYFVKAKAGFPAWTGTYTLAARLEARAAPLPPATPRVPVMAAEVEPNDRAATAGDASVAWRNVRYVSSQHGSVGTTAAAATADFAYELRAGDVMTVVVDSTSELDATVSLLADGGQDDLAVDAGEGIRGTGDARDAEILAFRVPHGGAYRVRVGGNNKTAGVFRVDVFLSRDVPAVVGRHVFYNNTRFDGWSPAPGPSDDAAIAPDKVALLPGQAATLANVTNFTGGINGVMLDVKGVAAGLATEDLEFEMSAPGQSGGWTEAPPATLSRRAGAGAAASDRYAVIWPDGAIVNRWLRATIQASPANGLEADDVFLFGNLVGESGDDPAAAAVTAADVMRVRAASGPSPTPVGWFDFNRDGRVNAADQAVARSGVSRSLALPATAPPLPLPASMVQTPRPRNSASRRLLYETDTGAAD